MHSDQFWQSFYEIFEAMPRQGPGERESTLRALAMLPPLTAEHRLLDVGSGSGTPTLDLAGACPARIVAVDNHAPFLEQLRRRAAALGLGGRVEARQGDMGDLPFADGSFDVIWSEGAISIVGFAEGLARWRRLLAPGGHLVVSELCWLTGDPPAEARALFAGAGAEVVDAAARRQTVAAAGYRLVGDFVLPASGWWEGYCVPLAASVELLLERRGADPVAREVAERLRHEIDLYRRFPGTYGYVFFVMTPVV